MTSAQHMLWMLDEYEAIHGSQYPGFHHRQTGGIGGSLGRTEATGYGVVFTMREALKELDIRPDDTTASVQGFGNVARYAIQFYEQLGGDGRVCVLLGPGRQTVIRLPQGRRNQVWMNCCAITDRFGGIDKTKALDLGYEVLPGDAWLKQDVDILIPAALENQINSRKCRMTSADA